MVWSAGTGRKVFSSANGSGGRLPRENVRNERPMQSLDGGPGRLFRLPAEWPERHPVRVSSERLI